MMYIISGVPGSGKSTIALELVKSFARGYYIESDLLRLFVKSGYASPTNWTSETTKQFELAAYNTCLIAKNAEKYGFDVVIDDAVSIEQESIYIEELPSAKRVWLCPSLDIVLLRNQDREKTVDKDLIRDVYDHLKYRSESKNWISIDNSSMDIKQTVDMIKKL